MPIDQFLNVTYKSVSTDINAYVEAMGVPEPIKDKLVNSSRSVTLTKSGGVYTATTKSPFKDHAITFTPGEEYEDIGIDGRTRQCLTTIDGHKMITAILSEPKSTITSEFGADQLIITMETGGVCGKEIYEKV